VIARICRSELIVIDIGMLPSGQDAAEAFYRVVDAAYERRSVAVTSNLHPPGRPRHHHAQDPSPDLSRGVPA
jgi:DNA replication protein DnaC